MAPSEPRTPGEASLDRAAQLLMEHQFLLFAMFKKMPNAREVLTEYQEISETSVKALRAEVPHIDFSEQDRTRVFLLEQLRDLLSDHDVEPT
jgi:hypothetical protein